MFFRVSEWKQCQNSICISFVLCSQGLILKRIYNWNEDNSQHRKSVSEIHLAEHELSTGWQFSCISVACLMFGFLNGKLPMHCSIFNAMRSTVWHWFWGAYARTCSYVWKYLCSGQVKCEESFIFQRTTDSFRPRWRKSKCQWLIRIWVRTSKRTTCAFPTAFFPERAGRFSNACLKYAR